LIGGVAGIILAMLKFGVWSLVVQTLTTYLLGSVLLWYISEWRPKLKEFSFECVRDLWDYSSRIFAFQVLKYFAQNTDKLIIGYFLGPVTLGFYTFAYKILVYPVSVFVGAIGIYLFPKFSRTQKDLNSIKLSYLFINKATNIVVFPAIIIVAVLCPIFIPFIWGEKWIPAIPLIQILSILGILIPTVSYVGQVMKALDHPGWLFNWSIFITILVFMLTWIGLALFGIMGATVGLVVSYVLALPLNFWILIKLIDTSFKDVLGLCMPAIVSIFFMIIGFVWMAINGKFFDSFIVSDSLFLSLIFYLLIVVFIDRPFLKVLFRKVITLSI
jgi:PST family polysaccharide transporter